MSGELESLWRDALGCSFLPPPYSVIDVDMVTSDEDVRSVYEDHLGLALAAIFTPLGAAVTKDSPLLAISLVFRRLFPCQDRSFGVVSGRISRDELSGGYAVESSVVEDPAPGVALLVVDTYWGMVERLGVPVSEGWADQVLALARSQAGNTVEDAVRSACEYLTDTQASGQTESDKSRRGLISAARAYAASRPWVLRSESPQSR